MADPAKSFIEVDTSRTVERTSEAEPYVGFLAASKPEGFKYDLRSWDETPVDITEPPIATLPRVLEKSLVGIDSSFYLSGIDGQAETSPSLELQSVDLECRNYDKQWLPKLFHGGYYLNDESFYLYSDESIVGILQSNSAESGRPFYDLEYVPKSGVPISIIRYSRNANEDSHIDLKLIERAVFSGINEDGEEATVLTPSGAIDWTKVETRIPEFIVDISGSSPRIKLNKDWTKLIGYDVGSEYSLLEDLEEIGTSTGDSNQAFYLDYFPVDLSQGDLNFYVANTGTETFAEWTRVEDLSSSGPADTHFILDEHLGIARFGDGINGAIPPTGRKIYGSYRASFRIEFEEEGTTDLVTGVESELHPMNQHLNQGFVCVSGYDDNVYSITLETDRNPIAHKGSLYGPIYVGTDIGKLIATVYTKGGYVVPNQDVTFEIIGGFIGGLAGAPSYLYQPTIRTNHLGQAVTFYKPPSTVEALTTYSSTLSGTGQGIVLPAETEINLLDNVIYTFAVYKDDPWLGKSGADTSIGEVEYKLALRNGRKVILYTSTTEANQIDPLTGEPGSVRSLNKLLEPVSYSSPNLEYGVPLVTPESADTLTATWLAAYAVISTKTVSIRARTYSTYLGRYVYSNVISFLIDIPQAMKGVYIKDNGDKIPFGFRIKSSSQDTSSKLTSATFLGINSRPGPYPIIDIIGGATWNGSQPSDGLTEAELTTPRLTVRFMVT